MVDCNNSLFWLCIHGLPIITYSRKWTDELGNLISSSAFTKRFFIALPYKEARES